MSEQSQTGRSGDADLDRKLRSALFAAAPSTLVDWESLRRLRATAPPPLSDDARCMLLLTAGNGRSLTARQWAQMMGPRLGLPIGDEEMLTHDQLVEHIRTALTIIFESDAGVIEALQRGLERSLRDRVLVAPTTREVIASDQMSAIDYALWVLLSEGFGARLRRCRFSDCSSFFFARQAATGAPSRTYCRPAHLERGEREQAVMRMQKIRGKRK